LQTYGLSLGGEAMKYAQRLLDHPAVREWAEAAISEMFIEPVHEELCLQGGRKLLEDLSKADQP
jgi:glutathione S-transferase